MYTYHKATENGMTLHIIETDASNIRPVQLLKTSNLKGSNEYGINGGWYTSTKPDDNNCNILNIAVSGGRPVGGGVNNKNEPRDGSVSTVGKHAIFYTGSYMGYMEATNYEDLPGVKGNSRAWAQGGVAMSLGNQNWVSVVNKAVDVNSDHEGLSAIVVNLDTNKVYLIATAKNVNYVEFRSAIQSYLGLKDSAATNDPAWKGLLFGWRRFYTIALCGSRDYYGAVTVPGHRSEIESKLSIQRYDLADSIP